EEWESVYASFALPNDIDATYDTDAFWKTNEHARLAHLALKELGVAQLFSISGEPIEVIDLNASLFRRHPLSGGTFARSPTASPLEERLLPQPAHYAGLPDFSYTMYDWINKNADCPPGLPPSEEKGERGCHSFEGWMGALNSSHFGTQSTLWFKHLHEIAIKLAKRARVMREKLERQGKETLEAYRDFVVEAEHEALAFEGYAQHFLQDRWSIGHMWERWNAADYGQLPTRNFLDNFEVAAASGLLHGSESVTGVPDPMSSPYLGLAPYGKLAEKWSHTGKKWSLVSKLYGDSAYIVPTWRHGKRGPMDKTLAEVLLRGESIMDETPHPGVGDHRLADMLDGRFGKEYGFPNYPLDAGIQRKHMLRCMTAGWTDVIKGLGRSKASGGYGISDARLPPYSRGMKKDGNLLIGCFDDWATNGAMALGWSDPVTTFGTAVRLAIAFVEEAMRFFAL
ncbi:MAG: hypothetical protein ACE5IM_08800, partial [Nitrospinota bacterium]